MSPRTTAIYLTAYGFGAIIIQIFIYPPVAARLGILNLLRVVSLAYPVLYFFTPYISRLTGPGQAILLVVLLLCKAFCGICAFPSSKIVLCSAAPSKSALGRLNGVSASTQQLVRAVVAVVVGKLFSVGLEEKMIVLPWWALCVISVGGAITVFWLEYVED